MSAETVNLKDAATGATAAIAVGLGFNCFSWSAPFATGDEPREMLWAEPSFESGDCRPSSSGIPLMFPFPGRISNKKFDFGDASYQLDSDDRFGNAIHGFAMRHAWRVIERSDDRVAAEFRPEIDAPDALRQWPSEYTFAASYRVVGSRLEFDALATNTGDAPMPFGFGTHAYLRLPLADASDPESTVVRAPVDRRWLMEGVLPTGATEALPDSALAEGAPLAGREFDAPHRLLEGGGSTELLDPTSGRLLRQTFDDSMTCLVVYTPGHRKAICLEPETCVPDPFRLEAKGVRTGLRTLQPGETYKTRIVLEASTIDAV